MSRTITVPRPELLAPAGQPDAAYAAFQYGADAVYLGLDRFSARAEAVNFTPEQMNEVVAFAHSLSPARRVYLALNTLVQEDELPGAAESLAVAAEAGVDAVIVQDLGILRIARERFPGLALHASTQLAIHNPEGVRAAKRLGFSRATLARELTLAELRDIARTAEEEEIGTEVFIHGTLCYSYSGLCLFSSIVAGRSGNRGRCVYSCREAAESPAGPVHPFSLKDLALGPRVLDLAGIGITSLKIEGRKKSPLYVAATVDHYRRILDNGKSNGTDTGKSERERERAEAVASREAKLRTIFARPWTTLFLDSRRNPGAADPDVVGHRGAPLGEIGKVAPSPAGMAVFLTPSLPVERHDGLQIDLPGVSRPYGLPVDNLYSVNADGRLESIFAAEAGEPVAVALPEDAPLRSLVHGLPVYQASSQAVKRSFPFEKPKPGAYGSRLPMDVTLRFNTEGVTAEATVVPPEYMINPPDGGEPRGEKIFEPIAVSLAIEAEAFPARDAAGAEEAARKAFSRTGGSGFALRAFRLENPDSLFVKQGILNQARRDVTARLEDALRRRREEAIRRLTASVTSFMTNETKPSPRPAPGWSILVESAALLGAFAEDALSETNPGGFREAVINLHPHRSASDQMDEIAAASRIIGREKIRIALPFIVRESDRAALASAIDAFSRSGWNKWLLPNLGSLDFFQTPRESTLRESGDGDLDLAADWPLYVLNSQAAEELLSLGFSSFTLSPEDDRENYRALLSRYGARARVTVYADLPLFIAAACAHLQIGKCRDAANPRDCRHQAAPTPFRMEKTGTVSVRSVPCGSVVFGPAPFSLGGRVKELDSMGAEHLCMDARWRSHTRESVLSLWKAVRGGEIVNATEGNFYRGLL